MSNSTNNLLQRFYTLLKVNKNDIYSVYVFAFFSGIISLSLPLGVQTIVNFISVGQLSVSWIVLVALVVLGVLLAGILQVFQLTITENLQQRIFVRSAFDFAYRIPRLKISSVQKYHVPELVNRFFDTLSVQKGLSKILIDVSSSSLQIIFGLVLLSFYHPLFIVFSFLLLLVLYLIFKFTAKRGIQTSLDESTYKYQTAYWLEELGRTVNSYKTAKTSSIPLHKTDEILGSYLKARKDHFGVLRFQYYQMIIFKVLVAAVLLLLGGYLVMYREMNVGQFVASEMIILIVMSSVEKLIFTLESVYDVVTALEKLAYLTSLPIDDDNQENKYVSEKGELFPLVVRDLSFKFFDVNHHTLKDVSFNVNKGEKVCLSGFNGSGKLMLLQIIGGIRDDYEGSISFNNVPVVNWNKESLSSKIGYCHNGAQIFAGSFFDNVAMGRPEVGYNEVKEAIEFVGLTSFVEDLKEGYNSILHPGGNNIPAQVRVKLMLARAMASKPCLLILEDNINFLAASDVHAILKKLNGMKDLTVLAITNNEDFKKEFSREIVLDNGKVLSDRKLV